MPGWLKNRNSAFSLVGNLKKVRLVPRDWLLCLRRNLRVASSASSGAGDNNVKGTRAKSCVT
jgi:hypothetical protein